MTLQSKFYLRPWAYWQWSPYAHLARSMKLRHISVLKRGLLGPSPEASEAAEATDTPEDTLSRLFEFSESTKGGASGLSGREGGRSEKGVGEGPGRAVAPKIPKAPKARKDGGCGGRPFIVGWNIEISEELKLLQFQDVSNPLNPVQFTRAKCKMWFGVVVFASGSVQ